MPAPPPPHVLATSGKLPISEQPSARGIRRGLVRSRLSVWRDGAWHDGTVRDYSEALETHLVCYDDGEQAQVDLDACKWALVGRLMSGAEAAVPAALHGRGGRAARPRPPPSPPPSVAVADVAWEFDTAPLLMLWQMSRVFLPQLCRSAAPPPSLPQLASALRSDAPPPPDGTVSRMHRVLLERLLPLEDDPFEQTVASAGVATRGCAAVAQTDPP